MLLKDQVVVITGSTTGIGRAIAGQCVADGARVIVHGRDRRRGEEVVAQLSGQAAFVEDDLGDAAAPARIVQQAVEQFGRIDAIVNNAAWVVRSDLESDTSELFERVMAINVRAPLLLIKAALPYLEQTRGCIANIGSLNALGGEQNLLHYSISKGALLTLSKNLANALAARHVRLYHFNVGWVLTENEYHYKRADGLPENWPETLSETDIPTGKMTTPEQVASTVALWLSDRVRPFSGTVMEIEQFPFAGRNPTRNEKN
jgi:NAD(P)-dependent dehydrogenase (short-subunit alcohol dehydrogenase family)